jgi:hypothetical protein
MVSVQNLPTVSALTLIEILSEVDFSTLGSNILFSFNYGMDGSGQHSDYSQLSKAHFSTKQVMNVCFALVNISLPDGKSIWNASKRGHNCPQNIRLLALFPSKESDELLRTFVPTLDDEIKSIKTTGLQLKLPSGKTILAEIEKESMSMCDGKMIVQLLQLGGSYCTMCHFSQNQCHEKAIIQAGFKITRTVKKSKNWPFHSLIQRLKKSKKLQEIIKGAKESLDFQSQQQSSLLYFQCVMPKSKLLIGM